jgi:hypothetical protein
MDDIEQRLDLGSRLVIIITFVLFVAALFIKGFGHDLLLEAGVFLVSVKLILMSYRNHRTSKLLNDQLERLEAGLMRIETHLLEDPAPAKKREFVPRS